MVSKYIFAEADVSTVRIEMVLGSLVRGVGVGIVSRCPPTSGIVGRPALGAEDEDRPDKGASLSSAIGSLLYWKGGELGGVRGEKPNGGLGTNESTCLSCSIGSFCMGKILGRDAIWGRCTIVV